MAPRHSRLLKDQDRLEQEFSAAQLADFSLENGVKIPGLADPNDSVKKYMRGGSVSLPRCLREPTRSRSIPSA